MSLQADYAARLLELVNQLAPDTDVEIGADSDLTEEIGLSSVEIMELIEQVEDEYDLSFPLNDLAEIRSVNDLAAVLVSLVGSDT